MKCFELDLTQCELPDYWGNLPRIIRLVEGSYLLDFDVADDAICQEARKIPQVIGNPDMPVGCDVLAIPVGAVLRRLPDQE